MSGQADVLLAVGHAAGGVLHSHNIFLLRQLPERARLYGDVGLGLVMDTFYTPGSIIFKLREQVKRLFEHNAG